MNLSDSTIVDKDHMMLSYMGDSNAISIHRDYSFRKGWNDNIGGSSRLNINSFLWYISFTIGNTSNIFITCNAYVITASLIQQPITPGAPFTNMD